MDTDTINTTEDVSCAPNELSEEEIAKRKAAEEYVSLDEVDFPEVLQFREMVKTIVPFSSDVDKYLIEDNIVREYNGHLRYHASLFTETHRYSFHIHKGDYCYLGAQGSMRKPRAGETWTRGNDLPDGEFGEELWTQIKNAILHYEIVPLSEYLTAKTRGGLVT